MPSGPTSGPEGPSGGPVLAALERAAGALPEHEERPQQRAMAEAVANAVRSRRHLVVQAGTGTGKSLAYLVPAIVLGARVVVSTATKGLQDQLAERDLPRLAKSLPMRFDFAVLKGRSNYICRQRVEEIGGGEIGGGEQLALGEAAGGASRASQAPPMVREVRRLVEWATAARPGRGRRTFTGDRAELDWEPSDAAWAQVSTSWRECPGASQCPSGADCFAETARRKASEAAVVVVNTHLYTTSLVLGEAGLLPAHDLVVFDEAHELEDIATATFGSELGQGRFAGVARMAGPLVPSGAVTGLQDAAAQFGATLRPWKDRALPQPLGPELVQAIVVAREKVSTLVEALRAGGRQGALAPTEDNEGQATRQRAQKAASHLLDDLNGLLELAEGQVAWVEGAEHSPVLRVAPIDVGAALAARLWSADAAPTAVLTSATVPPHLGQKLGLAEGSFDELDVGSPFCYAEQALLYCPLHLPDPRAANFEAAMHEELIALVKAAEGRTMALFTSWRAMQSAAEVVRGRVPWKVLTQSDLPKPKLVEEFSADEHSCLFATMGFWQGVDVPGPSLTLVTIDRLPFARPDDPLMRARRDAMGDRAFALVDVPRAATLLAQGAGRLVRRREDRGVVAVFDRRLGTASYRWELVNALPPMRRTRERSQAEAFLTELRDRA